MIGLRLENYQPYPGLGFVKNRKKGDPVPAIPSLELAARQAQGYLSVDPQRIRRFFDGEGAFSPKEKIDLRPEFINTMSADELLTYLASRPLLEEGYQIAQANIDRSPKFPKFRFNIHTLQEHIVPVTRKGLSILQQLNAPVEQQRMFVIAGMFHDIGNILSRDHHAMISYDLMLQIAPGLQELGPEKLKLLQKSIYFHREETIKDALLEIARQSQSTEEFYAGIRENIPLSGIVLSIADNLHIGPERANVAGGKYIFEDPYQMVELVSRLKTADYKPDRKVFQTDVQFTPFPDDDRIYDDLPVTTQTKRRSPENTNLMQRRYFVSKRYQRAFQKSNTPHFQSFLADFQSINGMRMREVGTLAHAIFPDMLTYCERIYDAEFPDDFNQEVVLNKDQLFQYWQAQANLETR